MTFLIQFGDESKEVRKIEEISGYHQEVISGIGYSDRTLLIPDKRWRSLFLGAGEEKAVFCVCDQENCVFALEVIDERTYLNGRLIDGRYFFQSQAPKLTNQKLYKGALAGLQFSGLVKVREFVHGYEWNRFQFKEQRPGPLDPLLTVFLRSAFSRKFEYYAQHYKDVHYGNVMFELREFKEQGIPMFIRTLRGNHQLVKVGLRAIDVR